MYSNNNSKNVNTYTWSSENVCEELTAFHLKVFVETYNGAQHGTSNLGLYHMRPLPFWSLRPTKLNDLTYATSLKAIESPKDSATH